MMTWELEHWITDVGADVLDKLLADPTALSAIENTVYQVWLLDTEARNGGLSQYFCNHERAQWEACQAALSAVGIASFQDFAVALNGIIAFAEDPYEVIVTHGHSAENLWYGYQSAVVSELKVAYKNAF